MKTNFFLLLASLVTINTFCNKKRNQSAVVVRDCTGVYLRINNKDFQICNPEKIASFPGGSKVITSYKKISECKGSAIDSAGCKIIHPNEGWIEVEKMK